MTKFLEPNPDFRTPDLAQLALYPQIKFVFLSLNCDVMSEVFDFFRNCGR